MAESNLVKLIKSIEPVLNPGQYVYATIPPSSSARESGDSSAKPSFGDLLANIDKIKVVGVFVEAEGITFVVSKSYADSIGLDYNKSFIASWITLRIHSALDAVGFTAAVSTALTKAGICCNVIAAFYHDHIFVPEKDAEKAITVLKELADNQEAT